MENASKALLMAGGMLLAILIVSLLLYAWSQYSEYQNTKDELTDIEDTAKFTEQFTNYNRDDVKGYELISLANQIADYNYRYSISLDGKNDKKYNPIEMTIDFISGTSIQELTQDNTIHLFKANVLNDGYKLKQNGTINRIEETLSEIVELENQYGKDGIDKIARNISNIFLGDNSTDQDWVDAIKRYNSFLKSTSTMKISGIGSNFTLTDTNQSALNSARTSLMTHEEDARKYYEYRQFKRALFKCTEIKYDNLGRVNKINFEFTGKIY